MNVLEVLRSELVALEKKATSVRKAIAAYAGTATTAAKKARSKKTRTVSKAVRNKIAKAQKARWAAKRAAAGKNKN